MNILRVFFMFICCWIFFLLGATAINQSRELNELMRRCQDTPFEIFILTASTYTFLTFIFFCCIVLNGLIWVIGKDDKSAELDSMKKGGKP